MPGRRWANPQSRGPLGWEGQAAGEGKQGLATPSGGGHRAGTTAPGSEPTSQSKAKQSKGLRTKLRRCRLAAPPSHPTRPPILSGLRQGAWVGLLPPHPPLPTPAP